ncbi:MAG: hypothetical protein ACE5H2_09325 [Terriglobia bacterium]
MAIGGEIVLTQKAEGGAIAADLAVIQGTNDDQVKLPAAAGDRAKGITALKADAAGKVLPVIIQGPAVGTASAAISAGSFVKVADTAGKLVAVGGEGAGTTIDVVGIALTGAGADGDTFDLLVVPFRYKV